MIDNKQQDLPHKYRENNEPHKQTGNINERNNNTNVSTPSNNEPNVEQANDIGLGDAGLNDDKLTKYTSNRSADA